MRLSRSGFTLLELMILVAIIAILALIATPFYMRYAMEARKSACIANMKEIEAAVELAKMGGHAVPAKEDVFGMDKYIKTMPTCPSSKSPYVVFDPPECPSGEATHLMPPKF